MNNYSEQKVKSGFEVTTEMSDVRPRIIDDIKVKIKPSSFEDIKHKNASIDYVDQVVNQLVHGLNTTLVPKLNSLFAKNTERMLKLQTNSHDVTKQLIDLSSHFNQLTETNSQNYKILREELDKLKSEFEKSTISGDTIDEWHVPANDMF